MRRTTFRKLEEKAYNLLKEVIEARYSENSDLHHALLYMDDLMDDMRDIIDKEYGYNNFID